MTKFFRSSLLLLAVGIATPALATPAPADHRVVVSTADLNLASARGQRALDRRLAHAVIEACQAASHADLAGQNDVRRCRVETTSRVAQRRNELVRLASKGSEIVFASR